MGVTIRQIAEAAGVSRGTVDRALNNRGRIKPEVADRIRQIAEEMGYKPNQLGRALSMSKNNIKIGVILQAAETPFMQCVLEGIERAKDEVMYSKFISAISGRQRKLMNFSAFSLFCALDGITQESIHTLVPSLGITYSRFGFSLWV